AEPVDRLELVPDHEQVAARSLREEIQQLRLEAIRVLELVDHDRAEALSRALADVLVAAQEVAGAKLEVLEVERALPSLRLGVRVRELRQELLQQLAVARRELLQRGRDHAV